MLLNPSIKFVGTHLYTWVERGIVRVKCLAQEHNTVPSQGLIVGWIIIYQIDHCLQIPAFGVNPLFASVLPVGFAGGHGTAGGLAPTYNAVSYHD